MIFNKKQKLNRKMINSKKKFTFTLPDSQIKAIFVMLDLLRKESRTEKFTSVYPKISKNTLIDGKKAYSSINNQYYKQLKTPESSEKNEK